MTTSNNRIPARQTTLACSPSSILSNVWMGAASGMIGITAVYPMDFIKTRMQNSIGARSATGGIFPELWMLLKRKGPLSFYKGLLPQLLGTGPDKAVSLATRDFLRNRMEDPNSLKSVIVSGAGAGAVQSVVMNPVEIVKVRMQLDNGACSIQAVVRKLGIRGLYNGFSACIFRDVMFASSYFTLYELSKNFITKNENNAELPLTKLLFGGICAGIPAAFVTTPLDVIKTQMQAPQNGDPRSFFSTYRTIVKHHGVMSLFAGAGPRVARIAPQFGIVLLSYEWLKNTFASL